MINKLPGETIYNKFAFHVSLLKEFTSDGNDPNRTQASKSQRRSSLNRTNRSLRGSFRGGLLSMSERTGARRRSVALGDDGAREGSIHSAG
jgi:hypothetical protein